MLVSHNSLKGFATTSLLSQRGKKCEKKTTIGQHAVSLCDLCTHKYQHWYLPQNPVKLKYLIWAIKDHVC